MRDGYLPPRPVVKVDCLIVGVSKDSEPGGGEPRGCVAFTLGEGLEVTFPAPPRPEECCVAIVKRDQYVTWKGGICAR